MDDMQSTEQDQDKSQQFAIFAKQLINNIIQILDDQFQCGDVSPVVIMAQLLVNRLTALAPNNTAPFLASAVDTSLALMNDQGQPGAKEALQQAIVTGAKNLDAVFAEVEATIERHQRQVH